MSSFHSVVTEQRVFICAVCTFIDRLLRAVLPDIAWDNTFLLTEEKLGALLDEVIRKCSMKGANEGDCCLAMAQTACNAMKHVCNLLKMSCAAVGLKDVASRYLDGFWFVSLLLNKNTSMLNRLLYQIDFTDEKPSRILMNVAAILNDRTDGYDGMGSNAKRKATNDTKKIISEVQKLASGVEKKIDESKAAIIEHVDGVGEKVETVQEKLREGFKACMEKAEEIVAKIEKSKRKKRNSKHTPEQKKVCLACWMMAQRNEELKSGTRSGKPTHEAAFKWYSRELRSVNVVTLAKFTAVLHTLQSATSAANIKALEAKIEAERKAKKGNTEKANTKCRASNRTRNMV